MVALGEFATSSGRRAGASTDFPVYSVTKHAGFVPSLEYFKKQVFSRELDGYRLVAPGDFAYATIHLDEGSIGIAPEEALISPMYTVFRVDHSRVDPDYLIRFLKSPRALANYATLGKGAIHRRKAISLEALGSLSVPLPSLEEQRRIAAILDQADAIRAKRRQVLAHLDSLTQAIFHEMFGDPALNREDLPRVALGHVATVMTGNSPSRAVPAYFGGGLEWIKSDDLGGVFASRAEEGLTALGRTKARVAPAGSVLVTCIAGSPNSIGKCSLVDREVAFNQQINAVLPSDALDPLFLLWQLKSAPSLVRERSTGGMKGMVNKTAFAGIEILNPSRHLQERFAFRALGVQKRREAILAALAADDALIASLQSRAFSGEL